MLIFLEPLNPSKSIIFMFWNKYVKSFSNVYDQQVEVKALSKITEIFRCPMRFHDLNNKIILSLYWFLRPWREYRHNN